MHPDGFDRALDACYDTLVAPEAWPAAFDALAHAVGAVGCMFRRRTSEGSVLDLPMPESLHAVMTDYVREGYVGKDYRAQLGWDIIGKAGGTTVVDHDLVQDHVRHTHALVADLLARYDLPWWAGVGVVVDGHTWCLSFLRNARQGPFDREEGGRLARLTPHLRRVVAFSERLAVASAGATLDALEHLRTPAMLLYRDGSVGLMNAAAEALVGPDLRLVQRRLRAAHPPSDRALQGLIASLLDPDRSRARHMGGPVCIPRTGRQPLLVEAMPVAGLAADVFHAVKALLLLTDIEAQPVPRVDVLRAIFGLTAAEACLASRMAAGASLHDAAEALGIAKNTARFQLRAVFAKTGVSRQAELVAVLTRLARSPTGEDR